MSMRRSRVAALFALSAAALLAAAPALAGGTTTIRTAATGTEIRVSDMAARGGGVVVGWQENAPGGAKRVWIRTSSNGGGSWRPSVRIDTRQSRDIEVDTCSGYAFAVSTVKVGADWLVAYDRKALVGTEWGSGIASFGGVARRPDIACAGERIVMAWFQNLGGTWHVLLHAEGVHDGLSALPVVDLDLGPGSLNKGLAVAGTADHVYVSWFNGTTFELRRFDVGPGPDYDLTSVAIAPLPALEYGTTPQLGAAGERLVIAYMNRADLRARVSTDAAMTIGAERTLSNQPFPSEVGAFPMNADIIGGRIIVAGHIVGGIEDLDGEGFITRSTNDGATWARVPGTTRAGGAAVGAYGGSAGSPYLAEAWDRWLDDPAVHTLRFTRP